MPSQPDRDADGADSAAKAIDRRLGGGAWRYFVLDGLLLTLLYVVLPYGRFASVVYVASSAFAAIAIALAVMRREHLFRPTAG